MILKSIAWWAKAPNISRPALEVRAGIDDLQRFFLHPLEQPSAFPLRDSEAQPKSLLGGESFSDQVAEPIAHIAGGVVRK